ncbi:MAG: Phosphatidate cytidylyltransferase [Elusimicrobia bacterium]|nr:Phosphatidate cytidylyltransferase [Elusimicrobiota bacterium]
MLLPRVLTSCLLVPLILAVVWVGEIPYFLFVSAICLLSVWEYSVMAEEGGYPNQRGVALFGTGLLLMALYFDGIPMGPLQMAPGPLFMLMFWSFIVFLREFARTDKGHSFLRVITTICGVVFFGLFLGHFLLLRDLRMTLGEGDVLVGREVTLFLIFVIWSVDTGAWLVGKWIGRNPLAPRISPKKSWEGAIGGTLMACAVGWFLREAILKTAMGPIEAVVYSLVIAIAAQFSDLIESLMKRSFGAKDSSQLLPGHGGILDRFDSFVFAAPFYYYVLIGTGRFQ